MIFSSVDLPQPEGPMIDTNSPLLILMLISLSAVVSTASVRKALVTFCNESMAVPGLSQFFVISHSTAEFSVICTQRLYRLRRGGSNHDDADCK
jgi:hypothetical protein